MALGAPDRPVQKLCPGFRSGFLGAELRCRNFGAVPETYSYDDNGNRTMSGYSIGTANRITNDGVYTYSYDKEGNITKRSKGATDDTWFYGYDHLNHMTWAELRAEDDDQSTLLMRADYEYDALGRRIEKAVDADGDGGGGTTTTRFSYLSEPYADVPILWADLNGSSSLTTRYLRGDAVDQIFARIGSGTPAWLLQDHIGSIRNVVNNSGTILATVVNDSFGNQTSAEDADTGDYRLAAMRWDGENGTFYTRGRIWGADFGGGYQEDSHEIEFVDGPNERPYVNNNPLLATDPDGLELRTPDVYTSDGKKRFPLLRPYFPRRTEAELLGFAKEGKTEGLASFIWPRASVNSLWFQFHAPSYKELIDGTAMKGQALKATTKFAIVEPDKVLDRAGNGAFAWQIEWELAEKSGKQGGVIIQFVLAEFQVFTDVDKKGKWSKAKIGGLITGDKPLWDHFNLALLLNDQKPGARAVERHYKHYAEFWYVQPESTKGFAAFKTRPIKGHLNGLRVNAGDPLLDTYAIGGAQENYGGRLPLRPMEGTYGIFRVQGWAVYVDFAKDEKPWVRDPGLSRRFGVPDPGSGGLDSTILEETRVANNILRMILERPHTRFINHDATVFWEPNGKTTLITNLDGKETTQTYEPKPK